MKSSLHLPPITELIYYLENQRLEQKTSSDGGYCELWFSVKRGKIFLEVPAAIIDDPNLIGFEYFPLAPWSPEQGYALMQGFVKSLKSSSLARGSTGKDLRAAVSISMDEVEELQAILRSRRQVFKRFRSFVKQVPNLQEAWQHWKQVKLASYLCSWYQREFPDAKELAWALAQDLTFSAVPASSQCKAEQAMSPESFDDTLGQLLGEDFALELVEQQVLAVDPRSHGNHDNHPNYWRLLSPSGDLVGQLSWFYLSENEAVVKEFWCQEGYEDFHLEPYLLDSLLKHIPAIQAIQVTVSTEQKEWLSLFQTTELSSTYRIIDR